MTAYAARRATMARREAWLSTLNVLRSEATAAWNAWQASIGPNTGDGNPDIYEAWLQADDILSLHWAGSPTSTPWNGR